MLLTDPIQFIDLHAQRARLGNRLDRALARVLEHGQFIMGPEVAELETALREYCGVSHAITCANGTDALVLALLALGVGPGDAVYVPTFTFAATAEAVALVGATPVFCDVLEDTYNLDPTSLSEAIDATTGLRPRGVIAVDLFGQPAEYDAIEAVARPHSLWTIADAAQSFGGTVGGRRVGCLGTIAATSFFPAKPLGCYGDGGALFTDDDSLAAVLRSLRVHGQGHGKYENVRIGMNSRLDTLQAAVLLEKLRFFNGELASRQEIARAYAQSLGDVVRTPGVRDGTTSAWAQYTVLVERRDAVAARLREAGIPTAIYYPIPLHRQRAYGDFPVSPTNAPVADDLAQRVLSLPMHPYLSADTQARISETLLAAVSN